MPVIVAPGVEVVSSGIISGRSVMVISGGVSASSVGVGSSTCSVVVASWLSLLLLLGFSVLLSCGVLGSSVLFAVSPLSLLLFWARTAVAKIQRAIDVTSRRLRFRESRDDPILSGL